MIVRLSTLFLSALLFLACTESTDTSTEAASSTTDGIPHSVGDTLIVMQEAKISKDPGSADWIHDLEAGDTVRVAGKENIEGDTYARVHHDGVKGWMRETYDFVNLRGYDSLIDKKIHIVLLSHYFGKDESKEIKINAHASNISDSRSIETGRITWKLYDESGKPASTDKHDGHEMRATFEGLFGTPIDPGESTSPGFNIGYSPDGTCLELHKIELDFTDGGSVAYSGNSLADITKLAEDTRLPGECNSRR